MRSLLPFERYAPGDFIGLFGALRSGKTLGAVRLAMLLSRRYGLPVASNIPVTGAGLLRSLDALLALRGAVVVWDEVQASLDSREWSSAQSKALTRELIMFGKRGLIVVYTSPAFANVDVRIRRLTRYVYVTRRRLRVSGSDYAVYQWCTHWYADDVLTPVYQFALRLSDWYGCYDTLYGANSGESLVLA